MSTEVISGHPPYQPEVQQADAKDAGSNVVKRRRARIVLHHWHGRLSRLNVMPEELMEEMVNAINSGQQG